MMSPTFLLKIWNPSTEQISIHLLKEGSYSIGHVEKRNLHDRQFIQSQICGLSFELRLTPSEGILSLEDRHAFHRRTSIQCGKEVRLLSHLISLEVFELTRESLWKHILQHTYRAELTQNFTHSVLARIAKEIRIQNDLPEDLLQPLLDDFQYHLLGLGPIEEFLRNQAVSEILVQGIEPIWIENKGVLTQTQCHFKSMAELHYTCEKIALFSEHPFSPAHPIFEGRWRHGERIELIHEVLAPRGPLISVRRYQAHCRSLSMWEELGCLSHEQKEWLQSSVMSRKNILVCGSTGTGKTSLLQALTECIPYTERWISLEDNPELRPSHPGHLPLLVKQWNEDRQGAIDMGELIRCSLRLRPDRMVVGEVRGPETLFLLQALSTGHEGSMGTLHARSVEEAVARLVLMAGTHPQAPREEFLTQLVYQLIDVVLIVKRASSGLRSLDTIAELSETGRISVVTGRDHLDLGHLESDAKISGAQDAIR